MLLTTVYLFVKLHDSNYIVITYLWRPFHRCFVHFRRNWNIKTSLIDSFATFLLLLYMKFLYVSFDLLTPVPIYNIDGKTLSKYYLYWDGTVEYFGRVHLPYAILAITVLIIFNILPLLVLCLYPCRPMVSKMSKLLQISKSEFTHFHGCISRLLQGWYKWQP